MEMVHRRVALRLVLGLCVAMALGQTLIATASPSKTMQLSLSGGTPITTCWFGCHTTYWWCATDSSNSWSITVTGAEPNSTVTLRRWHYENNGFVLKYEAEVGSTDDNGDFQLSIPPTPPSTVGDHIATVIVNSVESNSVPYAVGYGVC